MYSFLVLVLILLPASEGYNIGRDSRDEKNIIGGKEIDISQAPHMVSLLFYGELICGGSIINEHTILTAAHCVKSIHRVDKLAIRCGSSFYHKEGQLHSVKSILIHEKYHLNYYNDYDVGLIRVKEPIKFSKNAKPIPLPHQTPEAGKRVRISGWGDTKVYSLISEHLRSAEVDIVDWKKCKGIYKNLTPRMICASRRGIDSCFGDSGGGMDYDGKVVGIVSWGYKCAQPDFPGVYTNVADPEILEFIKRNLN